MEFERYCLDTSSAMRISMLERSEAIWDRIVELSMQGQLWTVKYVLVEAKRIDQDLYGRLQRIPKAAIVPDTAVDVMPLAGLITHLYPKMSRPWSKRDVADPWVVALAKARSLIVVSDEPAGRSPRRQRIPYVCEQEGVRCINSGRFIEQEM